VRPDVVDDDRSHDLGLPLVLCEQPQYLEWLAAEAARDRRRFSERSSVANGISFLFWHRTEEERCVFHR
jgi:hypothetical protein